MKRVRAGHIGLLGGALALAACGGSSQSGEAPQAGSAQPAAGAPADDLGDLTYEAPPLSAKERLANLDAAGAEEIVVEMESHWPLDPDHPLAHPSSLDDVEDILKLDQVNLYPAAIRVVEDLDTTEAIALHAQIELAWGETYTLLAEILTELRTDFQSTATELERRGAAKALDTDGRDRLDWLQGSSDELQLRIEALELVAVDHIAVGIDRAERLIERHPDSYLGYRVAADYYRIVREWDKFNEMLAKIEELKPDSNGLRFERGAAAFQTKKDRATAEKWYREALAKDPHFVRAQAHMLIIQSDLPRTYEELLALEKMNPSHQLVAIAGDAIKRAYAAEQKKKAALTN